jgi:glutathione S-transferase
MKNFQIPFEERLIPLDQPQTRSEILKYSPSAKVPVLIDGNLTIWESLAIAEYLHEKYPEKQMWPRDREQRAIARAISSEMHSGFQKMRELMSHDLHKELKDFDYSAAAEDVHRVCQIWRRCLDRSGGPFLFGAFSVADAMFAPVANRFVSYGVRCDRDVEAYIKTNRALPAHQQWIDDAMRETLRVPRYESQ